MTTRIIIFLLVCLLIASCATAKKPVVRAGEKEQEVLYIYPDGTMEFRGRIKNKEDVVIYKVGRGSERAAVKVIIPRRSDVYRDTITVERKEIDVPVEREK